MKTVPLGDLVKKVATWDPRRHSGVFTYVDLSSVNGTSKGIESPVEIECGQAPSRARQILEAGDVLVSTVRPNLNGVAAVSEAQSGFTASTGFTVLRPGPQLDGRFLFHWVRTAAFIADMTRKSTGASYPAVSDRIVKESRILLVPFDEQRRIAAILDKADALRAKRRQALAHLDSLTQSIFQDMFGALPAGATVSDVALKLRTGPFGSQLLHEEFVKEGIAVLGLDNVVGNEFRYGGGRFITAKKYEQLKRYTVAPGDVLISIMGTVGRCVVVPHDIPLAINTKHICAVTVGNSVHPEFLRAAFLWHPASREHLLRQTKGSIMAGLNMGIIKSMPIPVAERRQQQVFVRQLEVIGTQRAGLQAQQRDADELFSSLQSRAFRGEL